MICCVLFCVRSSFAIIWMGKRELVVVVFLFVFLVSRDCYVALPQGDMGLSAVCGISLSAHLLFQSYSFIAMYCKKQKMIINN